MLLTLMMAYCTSFEANPHFSQTNPGQYIEIVHKEYDKTKNETYVVLDRYGIDKDQAPYWEFMQPRPFKGQSTDQEVLKSIEHQDYVKVVGLQ